jgi:hypothetical protein
MKISTRDDWSLTPKTTLDPHDSNVAPSLHLTGTEDDDVYLDYEHCLNEN